jgi:hypothetical protein
MVQANGATFVIGLQRHDVRYEQFLHAQHIPYTTFDEAEAYPGHGITGRRRGMRWSRSG